jgi:hypothetical protein
MSSYALCTVVLSVEGQVSGADLRDASGARVTPVVTAVCRVRS